MGSSGKTARTNRIRFLVLGVLGRRGSGSGGCGQTLKGIDTAASLLAVLELARPRIQQADLMLLTGDLAHDEALSTYRLLEQHIAPLGTDWRAIPGNHDNPQF
ncbi:MAG TPA: hypothetical protein ENJ21_07345, partial [Chromatiaceae bacterium]|nr:hypothetical protein [Chromatiaceae bacterium]